MEKREGEVFCALISVDQRQLLDVCLVLVLLDVEVLELVGALVGRHHAQEISHLHLLEELLGQVLEVPLGE